MINDPLGLVPRRRTPTLHSLLEATTEEKFDKNVECFNCHKKGHKKVDCWVKGGRKEG
jgi:hypothetical protein